jgi:hypothetical protein
MIGTEKHDYVSQKREQVTRFGIEPGSSRLWKESAFFFNGVQTVSTRHVGHFWPVVPAPGDCENGEVGGMKIGRGNRSTRRKPVPVSLCPPQIPLDQTRARTRAATVGSQRLIAWAMTRPRRVITVELAEFQFQEPICVTFRIMCFFNVTKRYEKWRPIL